MLRNLSRPSVGSHSPARLRRGVSVLTSLFDVSPYDGGWCVKIADTGEVLFFSARRRAIAEARALARHWPSQVKVKVRPRRASALEETWTPAQANLSYLGASA